MSDTLPGPSLSIQLTSGGNPEWVRFSLPLPKGALAVDTPLCLEDGDGQATHLQSRALAYWPDRSVRWLEGQALLSQNGVYRMRAREVSPPINAVTVRQTPGTIEIANGLVRVVLTESGPSPLAEIAVGDQVVSDPDVPFESRLVMDSPEREFSTTREGPRRLHLRQAGPVRAVAEVTGTHVGRNGESALNYRLQVLVTAGQSALGLRYRFSHEEPGRTRQVLRSLSLRTRWRGPDTPRHHLQQLRYGLTSVSRQVVTLKPVDIRVGVSPPKIQAYNLDCLDDPHEYPDYMNPPLNDTRPMTGVECAGGWITAWVEDFKELCPKGLVADRDGIALDFWPEWAGELRIPQGRSREMGMQLLFSRETPPEDTAVLARVQALTDQGKVSIPPSWLAAQNEWAADSLLPYGLQGPARRFDRYLSHLASLPTVVGMWDLGDTPDPGYGRTYAGVGRLRRLTSDDPPFYLTGNHTAPAEWWEPGKFEPVWTNNEYDGILALCREALRGNPSPELRHRLRWFARHAIEVDFVRYSDDPNLHHGSPAHSAEHNRASSYPSHLWCEGLLAYYCLSGDDDAIDVTLATGDSILRTFNDPDRRRKLWHFSRELGWALLYLATLADLTGAQRFLDCAEDLANTLVSHPLDDALTRDMTLYAFGYSSIAMGIEALWKGTRDPTLAVWLQNTAHAVAAHVEQEPAAESAMALNYFNASLAVFPKDEPVLQAGMRIVDSLIDSKAWYDPPRFTKPMAMLYRGLSRFVQYARAADWPGLKDG